MGIVDAEAGWRAPDREHDVCVVGAGAAGITLALELAAAGHDCLVLEGGALEFSQRSQSLYAGESRGLEYSLDTTRMRCFGGTTNHWTGVCRPLDPYDFEPQPTIGRPGWPIAHDELAPDLRRAEELCELPGEGWDPSAWLAGHDTAELPVDPDVFSTVIFRHSPPTRFATRYGLELADAESITVAVNANVLDLDVDRTGTVRSIEVATGDGDRFRVRARRVVLALGGMENARFLLNVVGRLPPGPQLHWIGRCFMEHPIYYRRLALLTSSEVCSGMRGYLGLLDQSSRREYWAMLATTRAARQERGLLGCAVHLADEVVEPELSDTIDDRSRRGAATLLRAAGGGTGDTLLWLQLWTEQAPVRENRVTLGAPRDRFGHRRAVLDWRQHPVDLDSIAVTVDLLATELARVGVGRVHEVAERSPGRTPEPACHHIGTARMSTTPDRGVVDADGRVHGTANLYVAGSAVFPTAGYANPTLTIVALAARLARQLRES